MLKKASLRKNSLINQEPRSERSSPNYNVFEYHGGQNDYLNISKIILICNRTNTKLPGKLNSFRVGNGNFENSKLFEGLVILKKKHRTSQKGKKRCIASSDLFSPPLDVPLMLMTDFLQRTALNQCRWCGMEDNRCGRHVLDH